MIRTIRVLLLALCAFSMPVLATIDLHEFDSVEQEQKFKELSATLRCPKCQNNSIGDSNAILAQDLRQKVYEMLKAGKSEDEIVDYMIARYGNFVTYNPPVTPVTSVLWLGPLSVIVFGFGFIFLRSRKRKSTATSTDDWDADKEAKLKSLLEESDQGDKKQ